LKEQENPENEQSRYKTRPFAKIRLSPLDKQVVQMRAGGRRGVRTSHQKPWLKCDSEKRVRGEKNGTYLGIFSKGRALAGRKAMGLEGRGPPRKKREEVKKDLA